jgi:hypothetical protein
MLEESHPSLYWYTPKDSVDHYFEMGAAKLNDSLTETKFRNVLSYVLASIHCGHTTVRPSSAAMKFAQRTRFYGFPLNVKMWKDTAVVTGNYNRKDSVVKAGVLLQSIEGRAMQTIVDTFFRHLSADGYNITHKYQTLSNPGVFRTMYASIYGIRPKMKVELIDTAGNLQTAEMDWYNPLQDTPVLKAPPVAGPSKKEKRKMMKMIERNIHTDSTGTAFMDLNTFTKGNELRGFFRRSFRKLQKDKTHNLVIDLRSNGGGSVILSNLLTKYIADRPFKIADSLYAVTRRSSFGRYEENYLVNRLFLLFMIHKKKDGHYHFSYFEHKYFKPRKRYHYNGTVYMLTGGNTFSAASLVVKALKDQENVVTVGEETGGGAYGNTAWLIPDVILPKTKVRFRLPLFRLVIDSHEVKGRGVVPEVEVRPTVQAIRKGQDMKMDRVIELIKEKKLRSGS